MPKFIDPGQLLQIGFTRKQLEAYRDGLDQFLKKTEKPAADAPKKPEPINTGGNGKEQEEKLDKTAD